MDKKELMKRAWNLKKKKPMLSFSECLKWSWSHTGCVFGKEQDAVEKSEFVLEDNFMEM